jgi:hypothetical protein
MWLIMGKAPRYILYDLADLLPAKDVKDQFVKDHIEILERRMEVEQEAVSEQYECQKV